MLCNHCIKYQEIYNKNGFKVHSFIEEKTDLYAESALNNVLNEINFKIYGL